MRCQEKFDSVLSGQVSAGENVLVAVSGGADSICMAELFLRSSLHPSFSVAHCNFHLRGEESDADEEFVRNWCREHSVEFTCTGFDTLAYASAHGLSVEMAARELRYDWFASVCAERNFSAVAVAHNSNDNAETLVLNLLRGTGLKGLRGMDSSRPYYIQFTMKVSPQEFFAILIEEAEKEFDPLDLVYQGEVPVFEKYDEFLPPELVRKGFAYGILNINEMKSRILSWKELIH